MTQTLIGFDYAGVPAVKITKGEISAWAEPDSNVGSFLYNSKWAADVKIVGINQIPQVGGLLYRPSGSGASNFTHYTSRFGTQPYEDNFFRNGHFPTLPYNLPLHDIKQRRISNGRFVGSIVHERLSGYGERGGNWITGGGEEFGWGSFSFSRTDVGTLGFGTFTQSYYGWPSGITNEPFYKNMVVWRLPGDETAILHGAPAAPAPGLDAIEIDSAGMRAAKPGYDVRTATPTQIAFDSANHPTKIIGAADVACPPGVSSYDIGITIPAGTVADVHFYQASTIVYPANPVTAPYGAEYWFSGSSIFFNNPYGACRARFIILAYDASAPTSGNNDVIRQFTSGGQDVVQILRPGASASPSFADIIVDSRWPCLQILKEGFIPVGSGALTHIVNFDGAGTFPMVKYMTVHGAGSTMIGASPYSWGKRVRMPFVNICGNYNVGWTYQMGGDSTYCTLTTSQAVFHSYRGNPIRRYYANSQDFNNNNLSFEYDPSPIYGIRYYILGIPA